MKSLYEYSQDNLILEYRPKGSKNKKHKGDNTDGVDVSDNWVVDDGKLVDPKKKDPEKREGRPAKKKSWGFDEPTDDDLKWSLNKEQFREELKSNKNLRILYQRFKAGQPFFILGKAGWGKSSIIKQLAKRAGRCVMTVYLDKAMATDLDGIPVPIKDSNGRVDQEIAMPAWAAVMKDNPDKQFLLFFDEMNQAAPDVQNALMPIVLETTIAGYKFDNFMVGAAGNYSSENDAVSDLSGPLKSRFKPIIEWETNTDASWKSAFDFLHKKYDNILGKNVVDEFERAAHIFANPREIDMKVFDNYLTLKQETDPEDMEILVPASDIRDTITALLNDESAEATSRSEDSAVSQTVDHLANVMYNFLIGNDDTPKKVGRSAFTEKTMDMIPKGVAAAIADWCKAGRIPSKDGSWIDGTPVTLKKLQDPDFIAKHDYAINLDELNMPFTQWSELIAKIWKENRKK